MAGEIRFQKHDIGGELLPILTTGLYRDPLDTLREYIQNSIDAKAKNISLKIDPDQIIIIDDGLGMSKDAARKSIRLGISDKNPITNVGFRGIGIYSSFNMCQKVTIYSKSENDITYRITFDFTTIRKEILQEQERRRNNQPPELYLEKLLNESVSITESDVTPINGTGTKVILSGVLNEVFERLNEWDQVSTYLEKVVPLPFKDSFTAGKDVEKLFKDQDYPIISLNLAIGKKEARLYRPYTNDLFHYGGKHPMKQFELKSKSNHFGFAWICINDARAVLKNKNLRGLIIKKFGFSLNDRTVLEPFFPRPVLYRRMTGEIIIQHDKLIPNASRSDFEYNSTRQEFYQYLPNFISLVSTWANRIQEEDLARETLADMIEQLKTINFQLPSFQRNKEKLLQWNNQLNNIERLLAPHRSILKTIANKGYEDAEALLTNSLSFVKKALTETRSTTLKLEKEITGSLVKRSIKLSKEDQKRISDKPRSMMELLEAYGLIRDDDIRKFLTFLDENIIKDYLTEEQYEEALGQLGEFLEE